MINSVDKVKNSLNDSKSFSHDKIDKKIEKKHTITAFASSLPPKKDSYPIKTANLLVKSKEKMMAFNQSLANYPNFQDLWTKYKANFDDLKKAKDAFFMNYIRNTNLYQNVFEKCKGVHFGLEEKKLDNTMFINDGRKLVSWNIQYNPYIFIGYIHDDVSFENLTVDIILLYNYKIVIS